MKYFKWILFPVITLLLAGCSSNSLDSTESKNESSETIVLEASTEDSNTTDEQETITNNSYEQIDVETAKSLMETQENYLILDVRTPEEYNSGHIPNAVNIPNETITTSDPSLLTDKDQLLLVYCRSGNRSKQAAQKLSDLGYTNVKEFGGITNWDGEITTE